MSFSTLALRAEIVTALSKLGYHEPTEVQSQVIPIALEGKNIIVQSHTGSGKTALLKQLSRDDRIKKHSKIEAESMIFFLKSLKEMKLSSKMTFPFKKNDASYNT